MVHKHREILNNRNAIFSLCEAVKQAAKLSLNRMWRHFSLDDAYTKISGVFCPAPVYLTWVVGFVILFGQYTSDKLLTHHIVGK